MQGLFCCFSSILTVAAQKVADVLHGPVQFVRLGQQDQAEVLHIDPVKAGSGHQQDVLLLQQVESHLTVVFDHDVIRHAREYVEGRVRLVVA